MGGHCTWNISSMWLGSHTFSVMEWRWRECAGGDSELSRNCILLWELCQGPRCVILVKLVSRLFIVELMELGRLAELGIVGRSWMPQHPQQWRLLE